MAGHWASTITTHLEMFGQPQSGGLRSVGERYAYPFFVTSEGRRDPSLSSCLVSFRVPLYSSDLNIL